MPIMSCIKQATDMRAHVRWAQPRARVLSRLAAPTMPRTVCQVTKAEAAVSMEEELQRLRRENELLRQQLARYQQASSVSPPPAPATTPATAVAATATSATAPLEVPHAAASPPAVAPQAPPAPYEDGILWPPEGGEPHFWERPPRSAPAAPLHAAAAASGASGTAPGGPPSDPQPLHVVHLSAEMAPIAKVGGLGDVVSGLAKASLARGHRVAVMLPFYEGLPRGQLQGLRLEAEVAVDKGYVWDGQMCVGPLRTSVYWCLVQGCPVYLVRPADGSGSNLFRGGKIYGGSYNEMEAYLYFCRACLEFLRVSGQQPHILQLHDWHTAAAALLWWQHYCGEGAGRTRVVLTIHNMENTGECRQDEFAYTGLSGDLFASLDKALDERTIGHNPERLNLIKGGIVYSNAVTTVSPTYAREVAQGGAAGWLRNTFARPELASKFHGILNGIDTTEWDPATDPHLPAPFSADQPQGKAACKKFLQLGLGLDPSPSKPLVAVVGRLVPQKGPHLIRAALHRTLAAGGQFVLLGSGHAEGGFRGLAEGEMRGSRDCSIQLLYSESLAHLVYAAADVVLVPSMFEPCGLTQMIALRYGAVPVVRRTGGLADTVFDLDGPEPPPEDAAATDASNHHNQNYHPEAASTVNGNGNGQPPLTATAISRRNGFTFDGTDEGSLYGALDRALALYGSDPERWRQVVANNMRLDVSWSKSAGRYLEVYRSVVPWY